MQACWIYNRICTPTKHKDVAWFALQRMCVCMCRTLKGIKIVHPDRLPAGATPEQEVAAQRITQVCLRSPEACIDINIVHWSSFFLFWCCRLSKKPGPSIHKRIICDPPAKPMIRFHWIQLLYWDGYLFIARYRCTSETNNVITLPIGVDIMDTIDYLYLQLPYKLISSRGSKIRRLVIVKPLEMIGFWKFEKLRNCSPLGPQGTAQNPYKLCMLKGRSKSYGVLAI